MDGYCGGRFVCFWLRGMEGWMKAPKSYAELAKVGPMI